MKKGVKKIITGAIIFAVGMLMPFAFIIPLLFRDNATTFKVPGTHEIKIEKPGRYYLWNDYYTIYQGRSYSFSKQLPDGITFSLINNKSKVGIPMQTDTSMSSSSGSHKRSTIGYFDLPEPGKYNLSVTGNHQERIFSFGESLFGNTIYVIGCMILGFVLSFVAAIIALILFIIGIVDLVRETKKRN